MQITGSQLKNMLKEAYEAGYDGSIDLVDEEIEKIMKEHLQPASNDSDLVSSDRASDSRPRSFTQDKISYHHKKPYFKKTTYGKRNIKRKKTSKDKHSE